MKYSVKSVKAFIVRINCEYPIYRMKSEQAFMPVAGKWSVTGFWPAAGSFWPHAERGARPSEPVACFRREGSLQTA